MAADVYDVWFDPNSVEGDMVAECWISHDPRADDATFGPAPGDWLTVGDGDEPPLRAQVMKGQDDRVSVRIQIDDRATAVAWAEPSAPRPLNHVGRPVASSAGGSEPG